MHHGERHASMPIAMLVALHHAGCNVSIGQVAQRRPLQRPLRNDPSINAGGALHLLAGSSSVVLCIAMADGLRGRRDAEARPGRHAQRGRTPRSSQSSLVSFPNPLLLTPPSRCLLLLPLPLLFFLPTPVPLPLPLLLTTSPLPFTHSCPLTTYPPFPLSFLLPLLLMPTLNLSLFPLPPPTHPSI